MEPWARAGLVQCGQMEVSHFCPSLGWASSSVWGKGGLWVELPGVCFPGSGLLLRQFSCLCLELGVVKRAFGVLQPLEGSCWN